MAKKAEVTIGSLWTVRVGQRIVVCKVKDIRKPGPYSYKGKRERIILTNTKTGREVSRTAAALRRKVG